MGWGAKALKCFKNANNTRRILWAEGSIAELKGRVSEDPAESKFYISEASRFFYEIGMKERAAGCMETIGDFGGAAGKQSRSGYFSTWI